MLVTLGGIVTLVSPRQPENAEPAMLVTPEGMEAEFTSPRVPGVKTHGTGCTLSAAITAGLAGGMPLAEAVACAKRFVTRAIAGHYRWPSANGETHALNHQARAEGK